MFDKFSHTALKEAHGHLSDQAHMRPPLEVLARAAIPLLREVLAKEIASRPEAKEDAPKGDPKSR